MLKTNKMEYLSGNTKLQGSYTYDSSIIGKRPAILVAHDWSGRNEFAQKKSERLAELGYVGFAVDMYGQGAVGSTNEEKMALMQPLLSDRTMLSDRMLAAFEAVKQLEQVDSSRIGAIGFCFGGLCVLDLARSGANVRGVVSFHGLLGTPENVKTKAIHSKILVLHGHNDPMATHEQVAIFADEMTQHQVDWQIHLYGNTMHAFTNPLAQDTSLGLVYNKVADDRSWLAMQNFFTEVL